MRARLFLIVLASLALAAGATWAGAPIATPIDGLPEADFGGPQKMAVTIEPGYGIEGFPNGDLLDAIFAGADYLRKMQADVYEDNAGNGEIDDLDPDDAGWDWRTTEFFHSATASSLNLYGATVQGLLRPYALDPRPEWFQAMLDAADRIATQGAANIHTASDIMFLLEFAALDGVASPQTYIDAAVAIWDWRITNSGGGSATGLAEYIRDARAGQGYQNGIIAWDVGLYAQAAMALHAVDPLGGYDTAGEDIAEVLYQDSFALLPYGYFDVRGRCKGWDPDYANYDYYWYTLGLGGLIQAFASTNTHTDLLPELQGLMLESQYPDGAIGYQYGAPEAINDRDWQATGYAMMHMWDFLPHSPEVLEAMRLGGEWLASTQDLSGGFVYDSGNHYPEVGAESTAGMVSSWLAAGSKIAVDLSVAGPINCGDTMTATFAFDREEGTAGLRGYDITFTASAEVSFGAGDVANEGGLGGGFFQVVDNLDGSFTVSDAILGETTGLLVDADLFSVTLTPAAEGEAVVTILDYKLRDPDNADITAELGGAAFTIDCTAPGAASDIAAAPGHNKVTVTWTEPGADVAAVEVWRGMWYRSDTGASAYPRYDDFATNVVPARPVTRADLLPVDSGEWVRADIVAPGVGEYVDSGMAERGVYWYEVIPVDAAGNPALPADANDAATSYWLGDIAPDPFDGEVEAADIAALGATFGLTSLDGEFNFHADVGPSDDMSAVGIPTTDALVDFEDLMLFAINYGVVGPLKQPVGRSPLVLAWVPVDETTWALQLAEPCASFKGLRVRATLPEGVVASVRGGALLGDQTGATFLRDLGGRGLDVSLALFGRDRGFVGAGELMRVELSAPADLAVAAIEPRDTGNVRMEFSMGDGVRTPTVKDFALMKNYPNPFNPKTTIAFQLPQAQYVKLTVVGVDGGLVATLVDGHVPAGPHSVTWTGRNDAGQPVASGAYFYRIDAGPWSRTNKMILLK